MSAIDEMPRNDTTMGTGASSPPVSDLGSVRVWPSWERQQEQVVRLARRFVEDLINGALDARRRLDPSTPDPHVDWEALWACGTGSASIEQAVGRVVMAAENLARDIANWRSTGTVVVDLDRAPAPPEPIVDSAVERTLTPIRPDFSTPGPLFEPVEVPLPPFVPRQSEVSATPVAVRSPQSERALRRQRLATVFAWVRNAGVVLILFAVWQLWGTGLAQHQAQQTLRQQFSTRVHQAPVKPVTPAGPTLVAADAPIPEPPEGSVVAHLQIPAIGVDQYVVEGTAEGDLQKGPGHYIGTAMPGQVGNVAIAGHRTTYGAPFYNLNELAPGDEIDLTTVSGMSLDYVVTQPPVPVAPGDTKILNYFGDNRLTLTTCNPRYSSTQRLVVVALLREPAGAGVVSNPVPPVTQARTKPRHVTSGGSVGWNMTYLPGVFAVLLFIVLLGLANRRAAAYYGRWGRWLILVPIWVGATYLLFDLLSSFVPATL